MENILLVTLEIHLMVLKQGFDSDDETEDSREHNQRDVDARRRIETNPSE